MRSAAGTATPVAAPTGTPTAAPAEKLWLEFHPITELFFLALRAANLSVHASIKRRQNVVRHINGLKKARYRVLASLRSIPSDGLSHIGNGASVFSPHINSTYSQFLQVTTRLRGALALQVISRVFLEDDECRRETLMFYRLLAVLLTRAVDPRTFSRKYNDIMLV